MRIDGTYYIYDALLTITRRELNKLKYL